MTSILFSVGLSVSLLIPILLLLKNKIIKKYGFRLIYAVCLIFAVRLVIPYSFELPNINITAFRIPDIAIYVWAAGAAISFLYQLSGYFYFSHQLKRYSCPVLDKNIISIYEQTRDDMFIDKNIPLRLSLKARSPMLKGIIKPEIILTDSGYTPDEYAMIFRHELTHYQNRDNLKKLFFMLVTALQWFNPFIYVLSANLNESIECLCDEKVVKNKSGDFKRDYSMMLLKTVKTKRVPLISNLTAKEKLKIRIGNIFDSSKKSSSLLPIIAVTISAVMLSSFFCSCTVDTPSDVIEDMKRIESGVENEKNDDDDENAEITLKPVSEVTANARAEIEEISAKNGIFKFDKADIIIPQKDELKIYDEERFYGLDSPQIIYEQLRYLEDEWLGYHYADEDYTVAGTTMNADGVRDDMTIKQFLKGDGKAPIYCSAEDKSHGVIEHGLERVRLFWTPLYYKIRDKNPDINIMLPVNIYNCLDADEETLSRKFDLPEGEITLGEAIKMAEDYMNGFKFSVDEKLSCKVQKAEEIKLKDGSSVLKLYLRVLCDGMPVNYVEIWPEKDHPFGITELNPIDCMEMTIAHQGGFDEIMTALSNTMFTEKETVKEIISAKDAFRIIKKTLSNSIVYNITEVTLGNILVSYDTDPNYWSRNYVTKPVWNVRIPTTEGKLVVTVDAVTGEVFTSYDNRNGGGI